MITALVTAFSFILAQEGGGADAASGISSGNVQLIVYIVLFVGIFYFLLIRPGQKQRKVHQELVDTLSKGDEVMTAGGLYGTITRVQDDFVMLQIASKTEVKLARSSIARRDSAQDDSGESGLEAPEPQESDAPSESSAE
ncbi:MAG: preprotein translocase subunit YajC [Thermoleophilia bacterium]